MELQPLLAGISGNRQTAQSAEAASMRIIITVGDTELTAALDDNATTRAWMEEMPMGSLVLLYEQNGEQFERQHIGHIESSGGYVWPAVSHGFHLQGFPDDGISCLRRFHLD